MQKNIEDVTNSPRDWEDFGTVQKRMGMGFI